MKLAMTMLLIVIPCFFACRSTSAVEKRDGCVVTSRYVVRSLGSEIGTVNARVSGSATDSDLRADVDVNVGFLFFHFALKSSETASIRGGRAIRYRKVIDTGGNHREITGELDHGIFSMVIREGEKVKRKNFPAVSYELTDMDYPEVTLAPGEIRRLRVLDLEHSEVVDREYRYVAEEQAEIEGRVFRVVVSDFIDKNGECRRWTVIIDGLPIVRRQDGKEKSGLFNPSYSVRQVDVSVVH